MSAVTSSPLPLSAEWIPTLLQTSKEVRKRVNGEGKLEQEWEKRGMDIRGYTRRRGEGSKEEKRSYEQYKKRGLWIKNKWDQRDWARTKRRHEKIGGIEEHKGGEEVREWRKTKR